MPFSVATSLLTGAIFGTGLTLSGVANPSVIKNQFRLSDFHMLATFLTASATSAAIFAGYNSKTADPRIPARSATSNGWFGTYDGNVIGGAMLGLGISLTGACPGTVLVQATAGVGASRLLACTSLAAGVVWVRCKPLLVHKPPTSRAETKSVMSITGWSRNKVVFAYEITMIAMLTAILSIAPRSATLLHPVVGGLLIGIGQLSSVILAEKPVGVSGAYEEFGTIFWDIVSGKGIKSIPQNLLFACGVMMGSWATMLNVPAIHEAMMQSELVPLPMILAGGLSLVFGARIGGGCTSGHGISGMATMGVSSFVTIASMFGAGLLTGKVFS
ncbi:hypothetical protein F53441_6492 [Fusarium austroafricanum]|uniref:Sulphur transport domain-containing protein n=1 Tax=Fusarium austroafricanum TaxID=2364996 RepID=A0A8H4KIJ6_9HYPO|nr:hypothetical protein F53441_6492 [Fusarium austroafricanum]